MPVKLLTVQQLEFLSLTGVCSGSSESIHVKLSVVRNHMSDHILKRISFCLED